MSPVVADVVDPSTVHGVHGADGVSWWKCLARRNDLFGSWEAVEWAALPPGGLSGEHVHTRTEELYFILTGSGVMLLDGREHPVRAGDLVVNGLGTRHGLLNTGAERLTWLVIEVVGPLTATVYSEHQEHVENGGPR
ncbi:cupin domain-containing protein [Actinokineospora sp. PR83]|uniref:cupin domain-containing protein n=1 Tax=Actinokineospora sp. PR83 TaxID=2884908 RepID=UPI0027DF3DE9|nr:cupin domain-containing protein [Actinokineospora sp. PR83]MCG8915756.1 cupin domain-containing protein [Actinokineospora sp. PR83]